MKRSHLEVREADEQNRTFHGATRAKVSRGGAHCGDIVFAARASFRPSSCMRFRRRQSFTVWPVAQRCHADADSEDDQSQEKEKARGRVQAETTSHDHDIRASFPLSE